MEEQFKTCYDEVFQGWQQKLNDNGVIYYVKDEDLLTSWNHPYLDKVFTDIGFLFTDVRYAAYRTALKLRMIQIQFGLHLISLDGLKEIFPVVEDETVTQFVSYERALELVEKTLYFSQQRGISVENIQSASDLLVNLIANLYDRSHSGKLVARCIQNALAALCGSTLCDKYNFFCTRLKGQDGKVSREQLTHLVDDLMQIPYILKESIAFGIDVAAAVDSCLSINGSSEAVSVSPDCIFSWLCREPQTFLWLPTLHRIIATEKVQHAVCCSVCRVQPISGFRYQCLHCVGYNLCQNCFLRGCVSLSHRLSHQVKEYCFPVTTKDCTRAWMYIIRNKLLRRNRGSTARAYLAVEGSGRQQAQLEWEPRSLQVDQSLSQCTDSGQESLRAVDQSKSASQRPVRPLEQLGQPFDSSSPITSRGDHFARQDIENQHKIMALKIEELQQENRALRKMLLMYQEKCQDIPGEAEQEQYLQLAAGTSISPINNASKMDTEEAVNDLNNGKQCHDTLAIVGAITPVRTMDPPAIVVKPSTPFSPDGIMKESNTTDSTKPDGLQYHSSDMSLLSNDGSCYHSDSQASLGKTTTTDTKLVEADETYKPSDMSLLCAGLSKPNLKTLDNRANRNPKQGISLASYEGGVSLSGCTSTSVEGVEGSRSNSNFGLVHAGSSDALSPRASHLADDHHASLSPGLGPLSAMDLSNIDPENLTTTPKFMTYDPKNRTSLLPTPCHGVAQLRRKTLEPVHQSTPVASCAKSLTSQGWASKNPSQTEDKQELHGSEDKENNSFQREIPMKCSIKEKDSAHLGILTESNFSNLHNTRSMRKQAKNIDSRRDSKTLLTQDRDELNQIMVDFERECKLSDHTQTDGATQMETINDSSVMAAAFNIGDVLAEFVQAVAKSEPEGNVSLTTEMTHF